MPRAEPSPDQAFAKLLALFDVEMAVKGRVASCYFADGDDLLEIFRRSDESHRSRRSYQAKLFINLRMALECFLKSMVISLSDAAESLEDAYAVARRCDHHLSRLLRKVQARTNRKRPLFRKATRDAVNRAQKLKIGFRYEIDCTTGFIRESLNEKMSGTGELSGTIVSAPWLSSLYKHAVYLRNVCAKVHSSKLGRHKGWSLSQHKAVEERLLAFAKSKHLV